MPEKVKLESASEPDIVIVMSPLLYSVLPKEIKDSGKIMGADEDMGAVAVQFKVKDKDCIMDELEKLNRWFFDSPPVFGG